MSARVARAEIVIIGGPMFGGKTTTLQEMVQQYPSHLFYKPVIDNRYAENACVTHNGRSVPAINVDPLRPSFALALEQQVQAVGIDELNFFSYDQLWPAIAQLLTAGITVVGAGLVYDVRKQPFGATLPLMDHATKVVRVQAICDGCQGPADHSYRKVAIESQVAVGGAELYGACCEVCWENLHR
jgi:thymidine kinase